MEKTINYLGKRINFSDSGKGNALILLHGFLESGMIWKDFTKILSSEFRIIAIDLPGHGKSENLKPVHTMELFADVIKAVLDHLQIKQCVMIGHSMGGYATLAFAEKYPLDLKGIGLFHSSAASDTPEAKANRDRTIQAVSKDHIGFIRQFIPDLFAPENRKHFQNEIEELGKSASSMNKESIIAAIEGMKSRTDKFELLKRAEFPVLFISGKKDKRISVNSILEQAALPDRCEVQILGGVGHMGYIEAKNETLAIVRNFADKCLRQ